MAAQRGMNWISCIFKLEPYFAKNKWTFKMVPLWKVPWVGKANEMPFKAVIYEVRKLNLEWWTEARLKLQIGRNSHVQSWWWEVFNSHIFRDAWRRPCLPTTPNQIELSSVEGQKLLVRSCLKWNSKKRLDACKFSASHANFWVHYRWIPRVIREFLLILLR